MSKKNDVVEVGFEPTPPKRLELESSALDHSAIQPLSGVRSRYTQGFLTSVVSVLGFAHNRMHP